MADKGKKGANISPFLNAAIEEAERGLAKGGIPIGSVFAHSG